MDVLARRQGATADTAHEAATLLPAPAPLEMPTQRLDRYVADLPREGEGGRATAARLLVTLSTTALAALLTYEMWRVLEVGRVTALEWLMLALFALNIGWICLSFVSAVIGFAAGFGRTANGLRDETANGAAATASIWSC